MSDNKNKKTKNKKGDMSLLCLDHGVIVVETCRRPTFRVFPENPQWHSLPLFESLMATLFLNL